MKTIISQTKHYPHPYNNFTPSALTNQKKLHSIKISPNITTFNWDISSGLHNLSLAFAALK